MLGKSRKRIIAYSGLSTKNQKLIHLGRKSSPLAVPARGIRIVRVGLSLCWLAPLGAEIPNEV